MRYVLIGLCLQFLVGCQSADIDEVLKGHLNQEYGIDELPEFIIVVSERECSVCERRFADLVRPHTVDTSCLFIVSAEGLAIDMTGFLQETESLKFDDGSFSALGILDGSGIIVTENGRIDTVIQIKTDGIKGQLDFIQRQLNEKSVR